MSLVDLINAKKPVAAPAQMMKTKSLPKSQGYLALSQLVQKRKKIVIQREKWKDINFEEEIIHFDDDPLMYWKKKSEELSTFAALVKEYLGPAATSAPSEILFSIAGNFCTAKINLLGKDTFRNLMFIKYNSNIYEKVKL